MAPPGIESYRRELARVENQFRLALTAGKAGPDELALLRTTWQIMLTELTTAPKSVLVWDRMGPSPDLGFTGADRWYLASLKKAQEEIYPHFGTEQQLSSKYEEYLNLSLEMLKWGQVRQELIEAPSVGKQYLILGAHPLVAKIMQLLSHELMLWFGEQPNTRELIEFPARTGLARMLIDRPDLVALLRIADTLPLDVEVSDLPVDRPAMVEAVEFAIGLVPIVGSCVAAYEAWSGVDMFGYRLTDLERGILGASVLLPLAGRLVKGGRALYTEARLVALYGHDAAAWSRAVGASGRGLAEREALAAVERGERAVRVERTVTGALAKETADAVPRIAKGEATPLSTVVDQAVTSLFHDLSAAHSELASLDALAIERILAKGPNVDHLKGQLLEEIVESRIVPWLNTRPGGFALGITVPAGKKLEFIPGHLIRDAAGRQITDGILAYRDGESLVIAAVFEAKAGKSAARELSFARGGVSSLTDAEKAELRANAKDVWREQRDAARAAKQPFTKTVEDVEKEYALSERGGQVRRDVERLADGAQVRVGTQTIPVRISPTRTKFFGILPRDVASSTIEQQLKDSGFTYEILGVNLRSRDLKDIAGKLQPLAEKLAADPP
jgi:Pre-toxin TG